MAIAADADGKGPPEDEGAGFLDGAFAAEGEDPIPLGIIAMSEESEAEMGFLYARQDHMFEVDIFKSRLTSRGWILQDCVLSPRITHFFCA